MYGDGIGEKIGILHTLQIGVYVIRIEDQKLLVLTFYSVIQSFIS